MSYRLHLRSLGSGKIYRADTVMNLSPDDGRPVEIVMDLERLKAEQPNFGWYHPERHDMWRFGALLPLDPEDPDDRTHIVSLGEGFTPMRDYSDHEVARAHGLALHIKDEGRAEPGYGHNPTSSFKDRGMSMVVSMARELNLDRLAVPTQGNAGDSLAEYALAAGLEAVIVMPVTADHTQVLQLRKCFPHPQQTGTATGWIDNDVGQRPVSRFSDLKP